MPALQIVLDTNVLIAAFRSSQCVSFRLLSLLDAGHFEINVSVPLVLEYEDVLNRPEFGFSSDNIRDVVDYFCAVGNRHQVFFLWRPFLNDPQGRLGSRTSSRCPCQLHCDVQ